LQMAMVIFTREDWASVTMEGLRMFSECSTETDNRIVTELGVSSRSLVH